MSRLKTGVLVSGRGSNLQALLDRAAEADFPAEIACVVSNVKGAQALDRARAAGVPAHTIPHTEYDDRAAFEGALTAKLRAHAVELVVLAGFMRVLTDGFVADWYDRLINIHPSLLPSFPGLHTHRRALEGGLKIHGCTVHLVRPALDNGPVLIQAAVPVLPDDCEDSLAARVLAAEHAILPAAVRAFAENRVRIEGEIACIDAPRPPDGGLINPPATG